MNDFLKSTKESFEEYVEQYVLQRSSGVLDVEELSKSMSYSLFNGGKRFRPLLCCAVGEALGLSQDKLLPFAAAIEFIHTYSLIHDDLPCMDDDSERRGQPTNHIKFGEDLALLAGDSLLTEAFALVAKSYAGESSDLVLALSRAAGWSGMIRGQVLDLGKGSPLKSLDDLIHLHQLKTGQLIALCFQGPALLAGKDDQEYFQLGLKLGLAFQIKDDILDAHEDGEMSFTSFLGVDETTKYLEKLTKEVNSEMNRLELKSEPLETLISFNLNREV